MKKTPWKKHCQDGAATEQLRLHCKCRHHYPTGLTPRFLQWGTVSQTIILAQSEVVNSRHSNLPMVERKVHSHDGQKQYGHVAFDAKLFLLS